MYARILALWLLFGLGVSSAQDELTGQQLINSLSKQSAYGRIETKDGPQSYVYLQFSGSGPRAADVPAIVEAVKKSKLPVYVNCNGARELSDDVVAQFKGIKQIIGFGLGSTTITDKSLATLAEMPQLEMLYIGSESITNDGVKKLSGLVKLRKLSVYSKNVTKEAYVAIEKMVNLEEVVLGDYEHTDDSLKHMGQLTKLKELSLKDAQTTDIGMAALVKMKGIKKLRLEGSKVTAKGLASLAGMTSLENLTVARCPEFIKAEGFGSIKDLKELTELTIYQCGALTSEASPTLKTLTSLKRFSIDSTTKGSLEGFRKHSTIEDISLVYSFASPEVIEPLGEVTTLKSLNLHQTRVGNDGLKHLKGCEKLRYLNVISAGVTDDGFEALGAIASLEEIALDECKITGSHFSKLKNLTKLQRLSLSGNPIKDDALGALKDLKTLREVNLTGSKTTMDELIALKKAMPNMRIRDFAGDDVELTPRKVFPRPKVPDLTDAKADFTMSAQDFVTEYKKDRAAAEQKYRKKVIEITGTISGMGRNLSGDAYYNMSVKDDVLGVMCFTKDENPWVKYLPGQQVKIRGQFPEFGFTPVLAHCIILEASKAETRRFTADQFAAEYLKDPEKMNEKYKDQFFILTGKLKEREFNSAGAATLTLETKENIKVKANFTAFEKQGIKTLKVGDEVTVVGQFTLNYGKEDVAIYFCIVLPNEKKDK